MKKELLLISLTALSTCRAEEKEEQEYTPTAYEAEVGQAEKNKQSENAPTQEVVVETENTKEPEQTEEVATKEKSIIPPLENPEKSAPEEVKENEQVAVVTENTKEAEKPVEVAAEEKSIFSLLDDLKESTEDNDENDEEEDSDDDSEETMSFAEQVLGATESELEREVETRVIWSLLEETQKHIDHLDPEVDQEKIVRISQALLEMLEKIKTITVRTPLNFAAWNQLVQEREASRMQGADEQDEREEKATEQQQENQD